MCEHSAQYLAHSRHSINVNSTITIMIKHLSQFLAWDLWATSRIQGVNEISQFIYKSFCVHVTIISPEKGSVTFVGLWVCTGAGS